LEPTESPASPIRGCGHFAKLTATLGIVSIVSHPERASGSRKLFNTLFIIGREGQILGRQQKLHPTPGAEDWSSPGKPEHPVEVDGISVGLLICATPSHPNQRCDCASLGPSFSSPQRHGGLVTTDQTANGKHEASTQAFP
jgi:predicted amidohydrolase